MSAKKSKKKILFASYEATPFSKSGGLGDVAGSLPAYVKNEDFDVRVILPKIIQIPEEYRSRMKFIKSYEVPLGWRQCYCGLFSLRKGGVMYYFLDNEYYFKRNKYYGEFDDAERMAFFSKAVLETVRHIGANYMPDIIHCNDWHSALIPVFLHEHYRNALGFDRIKTVFTIHNLKFQGQYDRFITGDILGLQNSPAGPQMIHDDAVNFLQGAVIYADAVTTVSPTYAEEICTPQYGEGLEGLFRSRKYKLSGIVNGINDKDIDPETDFRIPCHFNANDLEGKNKCKAELQKELGFEVDPDVPLYVMIGRLTVQKGANLVVDCLERLAERNMQIAVLGTGDREFENAIKHIASRHHGSIAARIMFDESLSRKMYAGADAFLMPSQFEPCGLAQMMAMRYGTLPIVRETGGLKDTVHGYWDHGENADGFSFMNFDTQGLINAIDCSLDLWFNHHDTWDVLQQNAMNNDYGWSASAEKYRELYSSL